RAIRPRRSSSSSAPSVRGRCSRMRGSDSRNRPGVPVLVLAGIALALLVLPVVALLARAPWPELPRLLASEPVLQALGLSVGTALLATAASLALGVPLAILLARSLAWHPVPRRLLRAAVTIPLVLPPVIGGIALLLLLGRRGL